MKARKEIVRKARLCILLPTTSPRSKELKLRLREIEQLPNGKRPAPRVTINIFSHQYICLLYAPLHIRNLIFFLNNNS